MGAASSHETLTTDCSIERCPHRPTCSSHDRGQPSWLDSCSEQHEPTPPTPTPTTRPPKLTSPSAYVESRIHSIIGIAPCNRAGERGQSTRKKLTVLSRPDPSSLSAVSLAPFFF